MTGRVEKHRIEIPISSKPRPYRPGDGPAAAPITLALKNDSDAFILDKRVQPGTPIHGDVKLELYYVVGWPDLPLGRVAINARHIYDYVSPRTLEDFEYKLSLAREEEEERRQEALKAKREAEAAARAEAREKARARATATAGAVLSSSASATPRHGTPKPPKTPTLTTTGRKRGRPSKADLLARQMAQQTSVDEAIEVPLPSTSLSGPSLSTPQKKKRLAAIVTTVSEVEDSDDQDEEVEQDEVEELEDLEDLEGAETEAEQKDAEYGDVHSEDDIDPGNAIFQQLSSEATAVNTAKEAKAAKPADKKIPLRTVPPSPSIRKPSSDRPTHATPSQSRLQVQISSQAPPKTAPPAPQQKTTLQHYGFTPAGRSSGKWSTSSPRTEPNPNHNSDNHTAAAVKPEPGVEETPTANKAPRKRKRAASTLSQQDQGQEQEEPLWEVKRLEGDRVEEADDGTRTRYFRVRWKGHWPADQNPTWEPEENIPRKLIKEYLRRNSYKSKSSGSSARNSPAAAETQKARTPSRFRPSLPVRKYSSVSEAFEGAAEEKDAMMELVEGRGSGSGSGGGGGTARSRRVAYGNDDVDDEEDEAVDQLVVTTEQPRGPPRLWQPPKEVRQPHELSRLPNGRFVSSTTPLPLSLSSLLRPQAPDSHSRSPSELAGLFGPSRPSVDRRLSQPRQLPPQQQQPRGESPRTKSSEP